MIASPAVRFQVLAGFTLVAVLTTLTGAVGLVGLCRSSDHLRQLNGTLLTSMHHLSDARAVLLSARLAGARSVHPREGMTTRMR